jgi:hypothetical protein
LFLTFFVDSLYTRSALPDSFVRLPYTVPFVNAFFPLL